MLMGGRLRGPCDLSLYPTHCTVYTSKGGSYFQSSVNVAPYNDRNLLIVPYGLHQSNENNRNYHQYEVHRVRARSPEILRRGGVQTRDATWPPPRTSPRLAAMRLSNPDECPFVRKALPSSYDSLTRKCSNMTPSPRSSLAGSASAWCSLIYLRSAPPIPKDRLLLTRRVWVGSIIRSSKRSHLRVLVLFSCYWEARPVLQAC